MNPKPYAELKQELDALDVQTCGAILFYVLGWMDSIQGIAWREFSLAVEQGVYHASKGEL